MAGWSTGGRRRFAASLIVAAALAAWLAFAAHPAPAALAAGECRVQGTVRTADGLPVAGIHVQLFADREVVNVATDASGRYAFPSRATAGATRLSVELIPEDEAQRPRRIEVFAQQQLGSLRSDTFAPDDPRDCVRDFDMAAIPGNYQAVWPEQERWPALIEIYERTMQAWALAEDVGYEPDYGLPLRVYAWCDNPSLGCPASEEFAGFAGTRSDGSYETSRPYVVLGPGTSALGHGDRPDNREYHEFGHYFQAALFGDSLPLHPDNQPHGGYYRNPSSSDSFVEGFAEFYSVMVAKHIDGEPSPERYRIQGAEYDIELDHGAWEWAGWWEEFSLAGLLLDFEDGNGDYRTRTPARGLEIVSQRVRAIDGARAVRGVAENTSTATIPYAEVVVELLDGAGRVVHRQSAPTVPQRLPVGESGEFVAPIPSGLAYASVRVTPGPLPGTDDDPIDVTLAQLIDAIADYEGTHAHGNGHIFDVVELYDALEAAFGGSDRDGDGVDDVTQVFRAHGFFADRNGDQRWSSGEIAGMTSHPAFDQFPELMPRSDAVPAAESVVRLDTSGVATQGVVQVTFAPPYSNRSYGYAVEIGDDQELVITAPPRSYEATVTLVLMADGYTPVLAASFENDELWGYWDSAPGESIIEVEATLHPAGPGDDTDLDAPLALAAGSTDWPQPPIWVLVLGIEIVAVVAFAAYVSVNEVVRRRR